MSSGPSDSQPVSHVTFNDTEVPVYLLKESTNVTLRTTADSKWTTRLALHGHAAFLNYPESGPPTIVGDNLSQGVISKKRYTQPSTIGDYLLTPSAAGPGRSKNQNRTQQKTNNSGMLLKPNSSLLYVLSLPEQGELNLQNIMDSFLEQRRLQDPSELLGSGLMEAIGGEE